MTKNERKQAEEFIRVIQRMGEGEQAGVLMMLEGLKIIASKKRRITHRS